MSEIAPLSYFKVVAQGAFLYWQVGKSGGSVWGSNPPETLIMPPDGFEVREAHRDLNAPSK